MSQKPTESSRVSETVSPQCNTNCKLPPPLDVHWCLGWCGRDPKERESEREGWRKGGREGGREGGRACLFERNNKKQQGIVGHFLKAKVGTECSFVSGLCFSLDVCALQEPDG